MLPRMSGRLSGSAFGLLVLSALVVVQGCGDDDDSSGANGGHGGVSAQGGAPNGGKGGTGTGGCCAFRGGGPGHGGVGGAGAGGNPEGGANDGGHAGNAGSETGGTGGVEASGGSGGEGGSADSSKLEWARQTYPTFTRRTAEPEPISAEIFALCRLPTLPETEFTKSVHGKELYLLDWLNAEAQAGYAQKGAAEFPVGATIVKEKLVRNSSSGFDLAALGIMVKRAKGFDSLHGDWEFGYWESESGMSSDAIACGSCHSGSKTDFVFLDDSWRMPTP